MSTYAKIKNSKTYDVRIQKEAVPQSKANEMGLVLKVAELLIEAFCPAAAPADRLPGRSNCRY